MNHRCLICQRELSYHLTLAWLFSFNQIIEKFICNDCHQKFHRIEEPICKGCGRAEEDNLCRDCIYWQNNGKALLENRALYQYRNDAMQDYFKRYKFKGDYYLRHVFKHEFQQFVKYNYSPLQWHYCPIPVDYYTFENERGFNQVEGLIDGLQYKCYLQFQNKGLRLKQSHKNRIERMNTKQPFVLVRPQDIKSKKIVLIDDIYTTGRTLYHAQELLLNSGAIEVVSVTLAR